MKVKAAAEPGGTVLSQRTLPGFYAACFPDYARQQIILQYVSHMTS